jgi:hypothetical protein
VVTIPTKDDEAGRGSAVKLDLTMQSSFSTRLFAGRRILDSAEGVIITLRRCELDDAFRELVSAAHRNGVPIFTLAMALVEMTSGHDDQHTTVSPQARRAAHREWASLLPTAREGGLRLAD